MCGIAGVLERGGDSQARWAAAEAMTRTLCHRGPDSGGLWEDPDGQLTVGHRRLAILDLSPAGHQPMVSSEGRYVVVFNGEIYNHRELRARLAGEGVRFRGRSDTEVLCEAISRWTLRGALDQLNGMYAIAVWDRKTRALTLVRDRLGEKPLHYGWLGNQFGFSSELKALRAHPSFDPSMDQQALASFLRRTFIPAPLTIYKSIRKLPPGCLLTLTPQMEPGCYPEPVAYWSLAETVRAGIAKPISDVTSAIDELESLLRNAVSIRRESDVPLGAFLSGGVDSSLVTALLQAESDRPVQTFTVSVPDDHLNEADAASAVARHLGTDHCQIELTPNDAVEIVPRLPEIYDEPFADPSGIPTALMCAVARKHVTVCLSGDGGDELLAGYNRYIYGPAVWSRVAWMPAAARSALASLLLSRTPAQWDRTAGRWAKVVPQLRQYAPGTKLHKLAPLLRAGGVGDIYSALTSCWDPSVLLDHATEFSPSLDTDLPLSDPLDKMLYLDGITTLPDDMLVKVDRASMAVSLECRVPLLDHRVFEFAWRLPRKAKINGRQGKWLLRKVLARYVPAELTDRPKLGFDPPIAEWLRGPLRSWAGDLLSFDRLRRQGLLNPEPVLRVWNEHQSGQRNHDYAIWTILMFEAWLDSVSTRRGGSMS